MKSLKNRRAGWTVLLTVATAAAAATVFVATGAAGKSNLYYVNVGAAAFVPESSGCVDYDHDGYSGALVDHGGCLYVAHIDLPDGMKIGSITAYYNNGLDNADFRFEASNDIGDHTDLVDDELDGNAGDEGGAVCDGDDNCAAIWDLNWAVLNTSTHFGIFLDTYERGGFTLYRFKIKLKNG
jgi:hypothetical protein